MSGGRRADVRGRQGRNDQELSVSLSLAGHLMAWAWKSSEGGGQRTANNWLQAVASSDSLACRAVWAPESGQEQLVRSSQPVCTSVRLFDGLATGHSLPLPSLQSLQGQAAQTFVYLQQSCHI